MANEFQVHILNETGLAKAKRLGAAFDALLAECDACGVTGRERALVVTKLQEASMFAKRSIAELVENQLTASTTAPR